jgi:uncharacterized protein (UPF0548 family)
MFRLSVPGREWVDAYLAGLGREEFSYDEVGGTREVNEAELRSRGYVIDHNRVQVGVGREAFDKAKSAVRAWTMFAMPWVQLCWPTAEIRVGTSVASMVRHFGFVSVNPCRIIYTFDEVMAGGERYGFAYGTVRGHEERGEERFTVELSASDGSVWYDVLAFSRPGNFVTAIGKPVARALQRRFVRDSKAAMMRAVAEDGAR